MEGRCQRETGTAHALNALYEADRVLHTALERRRHLMRASAQKS